MAYVYGTERKAGSYSFNFRSFMSYSISKTNTVVSVTITAGAQVTGTASEVGWNDLTVSVTGTGQTRKTKTADYRTSKADSSKRQTFISSFTWSWTRGTSSTTKDIIVSLSGNFNNNASSYTLHVAIPVLDSYKITYNKNGGTGTQPTEQDKYYGKNLTLRTRPVDLIKTNYSFDGWNTSASGSGTSYSAGGTYTANAAATLYAKWTLVYSKPTIEKLTCYRVNDQDERLDAGTYIHVQFDYQCGYTGSTVYTPRCIITIGNTETPVYDAELANPEVPFSMIFGNDYDPDSDYVVTVKLYDSQDSTGITKSAVVRVATYPIDLLTDEQSVYMGIMHPAVVGQTITTKDLNVDGTLKIGDIPLTVTTPTVSVSATTGTLSGAYARKYGNVVQLSITYQSSGSVASSGNVFTGTLNTTALRPLMVTTSGTFFGAHAIMGMLNQSGGITIRNASSTAVQISGDSTSTVSFTYIVA